MKLSEAEWQIMNTLWQKYPVTAREVLENLPPDTKWAYTTLKTMLTRLVNKKAVEEYKRANTSIYKPLVSQKRARSNAFKTLLNAAFDGTVGSLLQFMIDEQNLTKKDRQKLAQLLSEIKSKEEK
jgi:BlaI family penicillinase repressor